jgi:hypothetical protein
MAWSTRRLLRREFAELLAGRRSNWSPRAVARAERLLRRATTQLHVPGFTERDTRRAVLGDHLAAPENADRYWSARYTVNLESRAWLLTHMNEALELEQRHAGMHESSTV